MKRRFLNLAGRRMAAYNARCYKEPIVEEGDGDNGDGGADDASTQLLKKISGAVEQEVRNMQIGNRDLVIKEVRNAIDTALKGLTPDQLKTISEDHPKIEASIRNIAAKVDQLLSKPAEKRDRRPGDELRAALTANFDAMERSLRSNRNKDQYFSINVRAASVISTDYTPDNSAMPDDLIDSYSIDSFVPKRYPNQYIFDFADRMTVNEVEKYRVWLEEGNEDGFFAVVSEGSLKPLVSQKLVRNKAEAQKVAGKEIFTDEFAKFRKEAYTIIRRLFNDKMLRDYQNLLTVNMQSHAAAYVGTSLDGKYAAPTDYHAIGAVAAQIESINFTPDTLILHPQDKWRIGLSQNTQGSFFVNIPVYNPSGQVTMMGFTLITSTKQTVGSFTLGEGKLWKIIDEAVTLKVGYGTTVVMNEANTAVVSVEDDLDHNRFRVIGEMFFLNFIGSNNTGSFVTASFSSVKAALTTP